MSSTDDNINIIKPCFTFSTNENDLTIKGNTLTITEKGTNKEVWKIYNHFKRFHIEIQNESFTFTEKITLSIKDFYKNLGCIYKLEDKPYTDCDKLWTIDHVYNRYVRECIRIRQDVISRDIFISETPKKFFQIRNGILYIQITRD